MLISLTFEVVKILYMLNPKGMLFDSAVVHRSINEITFYRDPENKAVFRFDSSPGL